MSCPRAGDRPTVTLLPPFFTAGEYSRTPIIERAKFALEPAAVRQLGGRTAAGSFLQASAFSIVQIKLSSCIGFFRQATAP